MIQAKKLAIASAVSSILFGISAVEAHVSYNTAPSTNNNAAAGTANWTGGAPAYDGSLPVNWVVNVHNDTNPNVSYTVSTDGVADEENEASLPLSGFKIQSHNNKWNPSHSWGAALGFGLIDMHSAGNLAIEVAADTAAGSTFTPGFTLFSGWADTGTGNKHQAWNDTGDVLNPNTLSATGLTAIDASWTTTAGGTASLNLTNLAAGHYSIWIGGNGDGCTVGASCAAPANQQFIATFTASPVPLPGAAWMFGTALAGFAGIRRRNLSKAKI